MPVTRLPVLALLACLLTASVWAAGDWAQLKSGMTGAEAAKLLGEPLIRTAGRGFQVWIYDGRGEAVFAGGPLKAWTVAKPTAESLSRPAALDVLIRPARPLRLPRPQSVPPADYYREVSATRFRYL